MMLRKATLFATMFFLMGCDDGAEPPSPAKTCEKSKFGTYEGVPDETGSFYTVSTLFRLGEDPTLQHIEVRDGATDMGIGVTDPRLVYTSDSDKTLEVSVSGNYLGELTMKRPWLRAGRWDIELSFLVSEVTYVVNFCHIEEADGASFLPPSDVIR